MPTSSSEFNSITGKRLILLSAITRAASMTSVSLLAVCTGDVITSWTIESFGFFPEPRHFEVISQVVTMPSTFNPLITTREPTLSSFILAAHEVIVADELIVPTLLVIILFIFKIPLKQLVLLSSIENYWDLKRVNFMKILITGITGRIGTNVANFFIKSGHEVTGFSWSKDQKLEKMKKLGCRIVTGDLENLEDVKKAVKGSEVVFHMGAAFQSGGPFSPSQYFDINVKGTFNVLEASLNNKDLKHLIVTSTDSTIPKYPKDGIKDPIGEFDIPQNATDWYGYSKILAENLCRRYYDAEKLPVSILRFSMVFGRFEVCKWSQFYTGHFLETYSKDLKNTKTFNLLKDEILKGNKLIIPCNNGLSWKKHVIDIRDIIHAYDLMMCNKNTYGSTYQIAGPESFKWSEVIPVLSEKLNLNYCSVNIPANPTYYEFDLSSSKKDFNFNPSWDIFSMIKDELDSSEEDFGDLVPTELDFRRGFQV